jgi:hypothetical protein
MIKKSVGLLIIIIFLCCLVFNGLAQENQKTDSQKAPLSSVANLEIVIHDNTDKEFTSWTGQMFNIKDGQIIGDVSSTQRYAELTPGNYLLMLHFPEEVEELKGHRPFTFTITQGKKTTFTLIIGASQTPDMEKDIIRTVKGEDYLHFTLPTADPNLCKAACEKDRNCGAYTYCYYSQLKEAYCYLIRGAGTPGPAHGGQECVSGVIQRNPSPYQVQITTQELKREE